MGCSVERYFGFAPDFEQWDADTIRESAMEVQGLLNAPTFTREDLPELFRDYLPSELSEQVSLLDVELFEVHPAKGVLVTSRHRAHDDVHYSAAIMVMFAECFWTFTVELQEGADVGEREGAVARIALDTAVDGDVFPEFDPYERKWDGIVPLDKDPLARLRILAARLVGSISLGDDAAGIRSV